MSRGQRSELLLGEWACLGIVCAAPAHGFAVAARLRPDRDIGRIWSLSRPLTYRALDQLAARGYVRAVAQEPGASGPDRTVLGPTRDGRAALRAWVRTPVEHLRDVRSELLLKLVIAAECGIDVTGMLGEQRTVVAALADRLVEVAAGEEPPDIVALWRAESSQAALRFVDRLVSGT